VNKPVPTPAAPGSMPATGLPSALPIAALVILGAAGVGLAVRRRRSE
jgi:LPXTG-motif cell wall-anchored protein